MGSTATFADFAACCALYGNEWNMSQRYLQRAVHRGWMALAHLPPGGEGRSILDIGSAFGLFAAAYVECFGYEQVTLIDIGAESPTLLRKGRRGSYEIPVASCNIEREPLPHPDASFDTVVCMEVFEHLLFDPVFAMNEICRVLKPGGTLLFTAPNISSDTSLVHLVNGGQPGFYQKYVRGSVRNAEEALGLLYCRHCREFTRADLETLAETTGLVPVQISGFVVEKDSLQGFRFSLLKTFVHLLFPRSRRVRGDYLLGLLQKKRHLPLEELPRRYPGELYTQVRAEDDASA